MLKTGYVIDPRYERHRHAAEHPERPERIATLRRVMANYRRSGTVRLDARLASADEIGANHSRAHVERVAATAGSAMHVFDADTQANADTDDTARLAAGGLLTLVDAVMDGTVDNGFAMVRPPGHHAEPDRVMGFCFFNNVAIAAHHLRSRHGLERILIVDWDVHHGNGTQRSFYGHREVLFISIHQYPLYPGTGAVEETGTGDGQGYTVNVPFPAGCGDAEYAEAMRRIVAPIARAFAPQFILVSAGFDCHRLDPLGGMSVSADGFAAMTAAIMSLAHDHAGGRCAMVLEGGYSLDALAESIPVVLDGMGNVPARIDLVDGPHTSGRADRVLAAAARHLQPFWPL